MALAIVGCIAIVVITRSKGLTAAIIPTAATLLRPEYLKSFIESYEEKMKILGEIDSLEEKVHKGRIPRQRYKIQRKTLETRVETLSRSLADYREKMRTAGGHYASMMRELEVAEIELNEVEANIKSIEARHSRGELSLEGHRKLLGDYERRKEKTETTIDGILLRLREEIR
jgi:chromosome segregation ATPase